MAAKWFNSLDTNSTVISCREFELEMSLENYPTITLLFGKDPSSNWKSLDGKKIGSLFNLLWHKTNMTELSTPILTIFTVSLVVEFQ